MIQFNNLRDNSQLFLFIIALMILLALTDGVKTLRKRQFSDPIGWPSTTWIHVEPSFTVCLISVHGSISTGGFRTKKVYFPKCQNRISKNWF